MPEYIAGVLCADDASRLETHLFVCTECHAELASLADFSDPLYGMSYGSAPEKLSVDRVLALKSEHKGMLEAAGITTNVVPFAAPSKHPALKRVVGAWPMLVAAASFLIVGLLSVPYAKLDLGNDTLDPVTQVSEAQPLEYTEADESSPYWLYRPVVHLTAADTRIASYTRDGLIFPPANSARMEQHLHPSARYGVIFPRGARTG